MPPASSVPVSRGVVLTSLLLVLSAVPPARAVSPLVAEARLVPGALEVRVTNPRPAPVEGIAVEAIYQHQTLRGEPARIEAGGRHTWELALPPPLRPGAATAVVRVLADDAPGAPPSPVIVALVATPGTGPARVRLGLDVEPMGRTGRAEVRLVNPGDAAVDGRVVLVLPNGLGTDLQIRPARLDPGGSASLPIVVENRGPLPPGTYPVYALFEYMEGDAQQTAIAKGLVEVTPPAGSESRPLVVGALALLTAIGALGVALRRSARRRPSARVAAILLLVAATTSVRAATSEAPIRLTFLEGDVSGVTVISDPASGKPLGRVEYWQTRRDDVLSAHRIARFRDGSSDEDWAEARVAGTLEALRGRSVIRDTHGTTVAEVQIDVKGGRIRGHWGQGKEREELDEAIDLPPRTYWGPLIFIVLKNWAANANDGRVVFRTVTLTPKPRAFDLEIVRGGTLTLERGGSPLEATGFTLLPTVSWLLDPLIQRFVPRSTFWIAPGEPPPLARFDGPRNYALQAIRIQ